MALLCRRPGAASPEVLKIAKDEQHAERLRDEARTLTDLRHIGIVELFGVERVGGRTTLRLAPAGDPDDRSGLTLADRLTAHGRLGLDLLDRFGDDLLEIIGVLESEGVPHRDLKPDNLGVRPRRGDRSLHLVLFDFSLARTPDTTLQAGTPGYLDPFLAERPGNDGTRQPTGTPRRQRLHEMATGVRPVWGDGRTDPIHLPDEVPRLDPELFDPSVRDGLVAFFSKALHRRPANRFDTADQMRQAWRSVFAAAVRPPSSQDGTSGETDIAARERILDAADLSTPVVDLGLSAAATERTRSTRSRHRRTAADLPDGRLEPRTRRRACHPPGGTRGSSAVSASASMLRLATTRPASTVSPPCSFRSLKRRRRRQTCPCFARFSGSRIQDDEIMTPYRSNPLAAKMTAWRGPSEVKVVHNLDRAEVESVLQRARSRWLKQPGVTEARNDLAAILERAGGVLSGDELALAILSQRGSTALGAERICRGRAVVRAALEAEASRESNRFTWRRLSGGTAIVVAAPVGTTDEGEDTLDGEELADYAANLGVAADQLATADPLVTPATAIERLRLIAPPRGLAPLSDHRLTRLAGPAQQRLRCPAGSNFTRGVSPPDALFESLGQRCSAAGR